MLGTTRTPGWAAAAEPAATQIACRTTGATTLFTTPISSASASPTASARAWWTVARRRLRRSRAGVPQLRAIEERPDGSGAATRGDDCARPAEDGRASVAGPALPGPATDFPVEARRVGVGASARGRPRADPTGGPALRGRGRRLELRPHDRLPHATRRASRRAGGCPRAA